MYRKKRRAQNKVSDIKVDLEKDPVHPKIYTHVLVNSKSQDDLDRFVGFYKPNDTLV